MENNTILYLKLLTCSLSAFACLIVLFLYISGINKLSFSLKLILLLTIQDFIFSTFAFLTFYYKDEHYCKYFTFIRTGFFIKLNYRSNRIIVFMNFTNKFLFIKIFRIVRVWIY